MVSAVASHENVGDAGSGGPVVKAGNDSSDISSYETSSNPLSSGFRTGN